MLSIFKFLLTAIISILLFHISAPAQGPGPDTVDHQQLMMPSTDCRFICKDNGIHESRREQDIIEPLITTDRENQDTGRQLNQKYAFSLSYIHDEFSEYFDAWNSVFLQLSRETSIGSLIGLEGQTSISQNLYGFAILDFSRQEAVFEPDHFYTRVTLQIRFEYRF